jgi:hypothetical protein
VGASVGGASAKVASAGGVSRGEGECVRHVEGSVGAASVIAAGSGYSGKVAHAGVAMKQEGTIAAATTAAAAAAVLACPSPSPAPEVPHPHCGYQLPSHCLQPSPSPPLPFSVTAPAQHAAPTGDDLCE